MSLLKLLFLVPKAFTDGADIFKKASKKQDVGNILSKKL